MRKRLVQIIRMVAALLQQLGYSLQANRKTIEGTRHPDRNAQFEHINALEVPDQLLLLGIDGDRRLAVAEVRPDPGRPKLFTNPASTGSVAWTKTTGMSEVISLFRPVWPAGLPTHWSSPPS
jgi:Rhodopirellula transposase DDE domain